MCQQRINKIQYQIQNIKDKGQLYKIMITISYIVYELHARHKYTII